jgi:hypothetical protein
MLYALFVLSSDKGLELILDDLLLLALFVECRYLHHTQLRLKHREGRVILHFTAEILK